MLVLGNILKNIFSLTLALIGGVLLLLYAFLIDTNLRDAALAALL